MNLSKKLAHLVLVALTVGGVLTGAVLAASHPAHAAFSGPNGPIIWRNIAADTINSLDPTTGISTVLCTTCTGNSGQNHPSVSPNGQTIVFACQTGLCTMPITGGSITQLTGTAVNDDDPSFTPDGNTIVAQANDGPLFSIPASGGGKTSIFGSPPHTTEGEVSPTGSTVAFYNDTLGCACPLNTLPLGGGVPTQLTTASLTAADLSWSPDGTKIAVTLCCGSGGGGVAVVSATGSNQAPAILPNSVTGDGSPAWSPDGKKIVVSHFNGSAFSAVILNADGSPGRVTLPTPGASFREPYWAVAASSTTTTTSGPTTTTTTACFGTLSGTAYKGNTAKPKKALAGVTVSAAPTPSGTTLTGTTNAAAAYSFTVPCGTYNKTASGPLRSSRTCHFGSGHGPVTAVAVVTNGFNDVENLFCKGR